MTKTACLIIFLILSQSGVSQSIIDTTLIYERDSSEKKNTHLDDLQLANVVITSNEKETVQRISQYDLAIRPINSSQDVLRTIPGLFIAQHAGGGKAEQIFLRGFDIDHGTDINLSVDGLPINMVSHAHGQGYSDLHFIIPETIERVIFNKGPYLATAGDFATAGSASFETKKRLKKSIVKLEGGANETFRTMAMIRILNDSSKNQSAYIAGEWYGTNGYFESDQNLSRINLMGKYDNFILDKMRITASASTFRSNWDASGQIPLRAVQNKSISRFGSIDDTEGGKTGRSNINFTVANNIAPDLFLSNQIYFSQYNFNLASNFTFFLNDSINGDQITQHETRSIYGYKGSFKKNFLVGELVGETEIGVNARHDIINDIRLSRTLNKESIIENLSLGDIDETTIGTYYSQAFEAQNWSLKASVRYDYFTFKYKNKLQLPFNKQEKHEGVLSPKVSTSYTLNPKVNIYAKAGFGFHSNDARVVAGQNRDLLPRALGADLGLIWKPGTKIVINTALWTLNLDQEFVYVGDEGIVEPGGKTRRRGVDISVRCQLFPWLHADLDMNLADPKALNTSEGNDYIPLAPTLTSTGGLNFNLKNGFAGTLRYRYLKDRPANEDNSTIATGYFLLDSKVNYTNSKFEISLSIENVLNAAWREAQFNTESRLFDETSPTTEIHFTPGTPFFVKAGISFSF